MPHATARFAKPAGAPATAICLSESLMFSQGMRDLARHS
jgi:hypothetical protein